jgi:hypothetical protein
MDKRRVQLSLAAIAETLDAVDWGSKFGMRTDAFGIRWLLNAPLKKVAQAPSRRLAPRRSTLTSKLRSATCTNFSRTVLWAAGFTVILALANTLALKRTFDLQGTWSGLASSLTAHSRIARDASRRAPPVLARNPVREAIGLRKRTFSISFGS